MIEFEHARCQHLATAEKKNADETSLIFHGMTPFATIPFCSEPVYYRIIAREFIRKNIGSQHDTMAGRYAGKSGTKSFLWV